MCGILGVIPAVDHEAFLPVLNLMTHRGPDGFGIWSDEAKRVTLGHRRLAILDLSEQGKEPMHSERYALTFNGEIFNFLELRETLNAKGYSFKTDTDAEVILAAWEEWEGEAFAKFNGQWAIALWDKKEQRLILSRDRFGQKPLYYHHDGDRFVFASEMKALVPFLESVEAHPQFEELRDRLFDYEPTERCLIKGISRFPFSHYGIFERGELKTYRYWDTLEHIHAVPADYATQVEEFRELFVEACKLRMRSDVPIGTALSGGMDSSATICTMAHIAQNDPEKRFPNDWQHAFVASLPGTQLDETKYAKVVTCHLDIPSVFVEINPGEHIVNLEDSLFNFEELYITSPVPMLATYKAAREAGVYVTLDGHGADELFSGYHNFIFHCFKDCGLDSAAIENILATYRGMYPPDGPPQFRKPPAGFEDYMEWATGTRDMNAFWKEAAAQQALAQLPPGPNLQPGQRLNDPAQLGALNYALYKLFHTENLPTLLRNYDRYGMAHGIEIRMPFLDHRLVTYCFSLPWTSKIREGKTKAILRDAIGPYMPQEIVERTDKMGFQTPIVEWLKGPWKSYFMDLLSSQEFAETSFVDPAPVKAELERVIQGDPSYVEGELAYAAFAPFLWERTVLKPFIKLHSELRIKW